MTLTFFTNLIHHHQTPVADEFYKILGDAYRYVVTAPLNETLIKGGYDPSINRPYLLRAYESIEAQQEADRLILQSDVVIFSYGNEELLIERKKQNKVTFHYSERWLKRNIIRHFLPKELFHIYKHYFRFRNKRTYMLCASAFTASDTKKYFCFPDKCFKWGYITKVEASRNLVTQNAKQTPVRILWVARFLKWKHPELPIQLAKCLKEKGYNFHIDMYGCGEEWNRMKILVKTLNCNDCVSLCGNVPNEQILEEMRKHEIFLFTSDRNEGWGAVANESMANGCVLVGSDEIGSVPFLVKDSENGLIYKSRNIKSLSEKVEWLLDNPKERQRLSNNAILTMQNVWSPSQAVKNFISLVDYIQNDNLDNYKLREGPASWA